MAVATLVRLGLKIWVPTGIPYITFFPVLLVAGILGGPRTGLITLIISAVVGATFFVEMNAGRPFQIGAATGFIAFLVSGGLITWLTSWLTRSLHALEDGAQKERLLVLELQHRVKNTLAIVQAIARQTFTGGDRVRAAAFTDRLIALGQAHNVLSEASWREVTLLTLAERALEPFAPAGACRVVIEGDDLKLGPDLIVDLALCLHELAANATKHGALSTAQGQVQVSWRTLPNGLVELNWRESGGPPVTPPTREGFGTRLLKQGLSRRPNASVTTEYRPEGFVWRAVFDAA